MSEETKDWELWRQRNGHVVVVKKLDNDAADLYRFQSVNCGTKGWFPRGRHSLGEANHPADLVRFLGIVRSDDQKPKAPCQSAEIERLREELQQSEKLRIQAEMQRIAEANALRIEQADEIGRLHEQLRTLQQSHNKVTDKLQAEHRGQCEGFRIAIGMILEKLDA